MCGRFVLIASEEELCGQFGIAHVHQPVQASYNVAPGQNVVAIVEKAGQRHLGTLQWGLVPHWTKTLEGAKRPINARSETALEKPSFREAMQKRRCLLPAHGFFEWEKSSKSKIPHYIHMPDTPIFAMAGLWERWNPPPGEAGESLRTCTILTTQANARIQHLHERMPVILPPEHWSTWLDLQTPVSALQDLMYPYPGDAFATYSVTPQVNRVTFNEPTCIKPTELHSLPAIQPPLTLF